MKQLPDDLSAGVDAWLDDPEDDAALERLAAQAAAAPDELFGDEDRRWDRIVQQLPPPAAGRRFRRWPVAAAAVAAAALALVLLRPPPPEDASVHLVTTSEAALPPLRSATRGTTGTDLPPRGPTVDVRQPAPDTVSSGVVALDIRVMPGPDGVPIDPGSLRIVYLRGSGIDLTDRVADHVGAGGIRIDAISLPPGVHPFEVYVEDIEQQGTRRTFEVTVR